MMPYRAPVMDTMFLLQKVLDFNLVTESERQKEVTVDLCAAILGEAGRLCEEHLVQLNKVGTRLWFSQIHRPAPLSRNESRDVDLPDSPVRVTGKSLDLTLGHQRLQ